MNGVNGNNEEEVWKWYPRCPAIEVSNYGRIRSKGKLRRENDNGNGYKCLTVQVNGRSKGIYVHRAVLETFSPRYDSPDLEVNHIDFDRNNNHLFNLCWVTREENMQHSISAGRHEDHYKKHSQRMKSKGDKGEHHMSLLDKERRKEIYVKNRKGISIRLLSLEYGVCEGTIERAIKRTKEALLTDSAVVDAN